MTLNPAATLATVPPCPQDAIPLQPTLSELPVGAVQKVGDYKILGILGSGGMGIVYKAFDQKLNRIVALKMLQIGVEPGPEELLRFRGEAESLGRLQHPNIVQVFDFGMHDKSPFLVMEYVNGGGLDKKLAGTPLPPRKAAELAEQLARAVQAAHEAKIVHRDLKPANILLTADGALKITDFGLAKQTEVTQGLTQTGAIMGTPSYMAPEQAQGKKDVGPGADIYSLGAILYEMLTGRPPFRGATLQETLEQVCMEDPAPPSRLVPRLPKDLQTICLKCLHKVPARRYATAADLAEDLKSWQEGLPVKARPTHSIERLFRIVARKPLRAALGLATVLVVALLIVLVVVIREKDAAQRQAKLEREAEDAQRDRLEQNRIQTEKDAQQARERTRRDREQAQAMKNLQLLMAQLFDGDLNTAAGQHALYLRLLAESKKLEKDRTEGTSRNVLVLADAFFRLGGYIRARGGNPGIALEALGSAERLVRAELATATSAEGQLKLALILKEQGRVRDDKGEPVAAEKAFTEARALLDSVPVAEQDELTLTRSRGELLHLLASVQARDAETHATALKNYQDALKLRRDVVKHDQANADDHRNLARTLGYMGDLYLDLRDFRQADAVYWESHRLREELAKNNARDYESRFQLARSWENFGRYQTRRHSLTTAIWFYEKTLVIREELCRRQPDNREYASDLIAAQNQIAELTLLGDPPSATERTRLGKLLEHSLELVREQLEGTPDNVSLLATQGETHTLLARLQMMGANPDRKKITDALRQARDSYKAVLDQRKLRADECYSYAACFALSAEASRAGKGALDGTTFVEQARKHLAEAFERKFTRLSAEEIVRDRAFAECVKEAWFQSILHPKPATVPAN